MKINYFQVEGSAKEALNMSAIFDLASEPRILVFIFSCFIVGTSTGILWTYQVSFKIRFKLKLS